MASAIEILLKAKNETDAAFKAVVKHLEDTGKEAKKTNDILSKMSDDLSGKFGGAVSDLTGKIGPLGSTLSALGPIGVAVAAGIGAMVAVIGAAAKISFDAASAAAKYGDDMAALADRTGLSTDALQAFEVAAELGNSTIEAVAAGVNKMQLALVNSSPAFKKLGLDIGSLKAMEPDKAFTMVAQAIEKISDPAERAAARVAIFGKAGNELAGTLKAAAQGAGELGGALSGPALAASAAMKDKVDLLSKAWERVEKQFGAAINQSPEVQHAIEQITDALVDFAQKIADATPGIVKFFDGMVTWARLAIAAIQGFANLESLDQLKGRAQEIALDSQEAAERAQIKARQLAFERKHLVEEEVKFSGKGEDDKLKAQAAAAARRQELFEQVIFKEKQKIASWNGEQIAGSLALLDSLVKIWNDGAEEYEKATEAEEDARVKAEDAKGAAIARTRRDQKEAALEMLANIRDLASSVMDFGQLIGGAFGKFLDIAGQVTHAVLNIKDSIAQMKGGSLFDKLLGGIGIAGTVISVAKNIFGAIFGGAKKAREEMDKLKSTFISSQGGMASLAAKAKEAGVALDAMFRAKSAAALQAAIANIKTQLDLWGEAQDHLRDAMEEYGISVEQMGPKFAQQELDKQVAKVAEAFQLLTLAGADAGMVAEKMGDKVLELVHQYQAAGLAIPEALRPVLEAMLKNGQLVDENGEAYTSLEAAGIKFAESMTDAMKGLMEQVQRLVEALARGFNIPINFDYTQTGSPPGGSGGGPPPSHGVPEFAAGGPTGSYKGLAYVHQNEFMLSSENMKRVEKVLGMALALASSASGGGGSSAPVAVYLNGRQLNSEINNAMRQGRIRSPQMQRGGGRTF